MEEVFLYFLQTSAYPPSTLNQQWQRGPHLFPYQITLESSLPKSTQKQEAAMTWDISQRGIYAYSLHFLTSLLLFNPGPAHPLEMLSSNT